MVETSKFKTRNSFVVGIHQPNFFPWLGYFNKISLTETFVFLDDVDFSSSNGSYTKRCKIKLREEAHWLGIPVNPSKRTGKRIDQIKLPVEDHWKDIVINKLTEAYKYSKYFDEVILMVNKIFEAKAEYLSDLNISAVKCIGDKIGLENQKYIKSSELHVISTGTQRLVDLIAKLKSDTYLSGLGSSGYLEADLFEKNNISLRFQENYSFSYPQGKGEFIRGLSVIDALMNVGFEKTKNLILRGSYE
jgi:hypothetical protein